MDFLRFSRKSTLAFSILTLGMLAVTSPSQAGLFEKNAINKKGAQHLKKMFEDALQEENRQLAAQGGNLKIDGEVTVEPSDTYYAITLPHLTATNIDKSTVDIGMVAMNALPTDKKGQWKMTMALPTPIVWHGPDGMKTVTIDIGKQNFAGIWHEEYSTYVKMQANYQDIRITSNDGALNMTVGGLKAVTDFTEDKNGHWSGPATFGLSDFRVGGPTGSFRLGSLEGTTEVFDYDMKAAKAFRENMQALTESYKSGDAGAANAVTPQHASAMYNMVTGFLGTVWDGFSSHAVVRDIEFSSAATPTSPAHSVKIGEQTFDFSLRGFRAQAVALGFALGYNQIAVTPSPQYVETVPDHARLAIEINNLPYKDMVALGGSAITNSGAAPQNGQMLAMQMMMTLPQLLTKAGTNITLREFTLGNAQYSATGKGVLTADMQALKGATGSGTVEISGLETLINLVQGHLKSPSATAQEKESLDKLLKTLSLIQMLGQQGTDAGGRAVRMYNFELTKDGKTMLNGTDLGTLTQQAPPQQQALPPPVPGSIMPRTTP